MVGSFFAEILVCKKIIFKALGRVWKKISTNKVHVLDHSEPSGLEWAQQTWI